MTTLTLLTLSLSSAALCISICALIAASRTSARSQSKRLSALSMRLEELDQADELFKVELHKLRARMTMEKLRTKNRQVEIADQLISDFSSGSQNGGADQEAAKDEWTRQTNLKIARGEIRPLGRR